jgi:hypothetical protein
VRHEAAFKAAIISNKLFALTNFLAEFYNGGARQKAELISQQEACKDLDFRI